jgi:hypothetical protein
LFYVPAGKFLSSRDNRNGVIQACTAIGKMPTFTMFLNDQVETKNLSSSAEIFSRTVCFLEIVSLTFAFPKTTG